MRGRRLYTRENGSIPPLEPGDYGHADYRGRGPADIMNQWVVCAPNGAACRLDPSIHTVIEHPDGTITVAPSIVIPNDGPIRFHGFLERGEWR